MTKEEIADLFIRAAWIDSRLPDNARPKKIKGSWVPFFHSTADIIDRRATGIRSGKHREFLTDGDDPLEEWRAAFWEGLENRLSREDIGIWERAMDLVAIVADEGNRRALLAWAKSKIGTLEAKTGKRKKVRKDVTFAAWCRSEGIHEMTGSRRMNRAITVIEQHLVRGSSQNGQSGCFGVLPDGPVFEQIADTPEADAPNIGRTYERDAATVSAKEATLFDWNEVRNQRRRAARRFQKEQAERLRAAGSAA